MKSSKLIIETRAIVADILDDDSVTMARARNADDDSVILLVAVNLLIAQKLDTLCDRLDHCIGIMSSLSNTRKHQLQ